jgi:hypothetical protein
MVATLQGASDERRHATPARDVRLYRPEAKKLGANRMFHSIVRSGLEYCGAPALPVPSSPPAG